MAISSGYSAEDLARLGPDALTRRRMLAEALLAKSAGQRKIEHPLQGAAQMAEALINGLRVRKLDQAETAGMQSGESAWSSLFGGSNASAPSAAMPATTGAGQELAATSPAVSPSGDMNAYRNAIASIESAGSGDYAAVGPTHPKLGRALGRYQIMEANIGPWSQEALGRAVTPDEFMADPKLQDAIFDKKFGGYVEKYGPEGAAQAWIGGPGGVGKLDRKDSLGTSIGAYGQKFNRAVGANPQVASIDPAAGMPQVAAPQVPPAASAYVDPTISAPNAQPRQMAALPPAEGMPPLEPPRAIGTPPVPPNAPPPQQLAQALTGNSAPPQQQGPSVQDLAKIIANPWVSDDKKKIAQVLLGQKLEQNDPLKKMQLEKGQLEIDQLRNPRLSPADQARLDMERQKLELDRNKPTEVNGRLVGPDGKIVYEGGLSAEQDARLKLDREKFEAEKAKGQWQKLTDGRLYNETTGEFKDAPPPAPGSVPPKFDDISSVRKEIQQLPAYKNMAQAAPIYKSMVETAGRNTRASDLNLVYGLGKIMDPTSVVREGEMVMVKNTASLPDWLVGAANALNGGAALQPETRKAIMTEAFGRMKGYSDEFEKNTGQYKGIAQRFNMNPDDVIPPFEQFQPWDGVADTPSPASPSSPADGMKKTTTGIPWRPIQ